MRVKYTFVCVFGGKVRACFLSFLFPFINIFFFLAIQIDR